MHTVMVDLTGNQNLDINGEAVNINDIRGIVVDEHFHIISVFIEKITETEIILKGE